MPSSADHTAFTTTLERVHCTVGPQTVGYAATGGHLTSVSTLYRTPASAPLPTALAEYAVGHGYGTQEQSFALDEYPLGSGHGTASPYVVAEPLSRTGCGYS